MTIPSFCTLNSRSVIKISGSDAKDFLQGLITNEISAASTSQAIYAALLTPQGKILFDFFISQPQPDIYWLECSRDQCAELTKRLTFYKLRADVTLTPLGDDLKVSCIWGEGIQGLLDIANAGAAGPVLGGYGYVDPRTAQAGLRIIATAEDLAENLGNFEVNIVDSEVYTAHRVQLGLADSDADIGSSLRFAHECNLDMTNGVDFSKGCYVGQEVVSRMHHKQAARKRILVISSSHPLETGATVSVEDRSIGEVLSTVNTHALATIRLDKAHSALTAQKEITVDGMAINFDKPDWVKFTFPGGATLD